MQICWNDIREVCYCPVACVVMINKAINIVELLLSYMNCNSSEKILPPWLETWNKQLAAECVCDAAWSRHKKWFPPIVLKLICYFRPLPLTIACSFLHRTILWIKKRKNLFCEWFKANFNNAIIETFLISIFSRLSTAQQKKDVTKCFSWRLTESFVHNSRNPFCFFYVCQACLLLMNRSSKLKLWRAIGSKR